MVKYYTPQVEPLKNGKFKYSIRYTDPSFIGVHKSSTTITKNTAHARNLAEIKVKNAIKERLSIRSVKQITMDKLIDKLKDNLDQQGLAPKTLDTYFAYLNKLSKQFKDRSVTSITTTELNAYINDILYKNKLSNVSAHHYHVIFLKLFDFAIQFGYAKENPALKVKINFKNDRAKKQERIENWYLTDKELKEVFDYCLKKNRTDLYDLFKMLYLTGMRVGEGCALLVKNIFQDPETHMWYVTISGTLINTDGHRNERQEFTKTVASHRTIVLPKEAVSIYRKLAKDQSANDFLFHNKYSHGPISILTVSRFLRKFVTSEKWKKHITSHIFRHTHVSKLAEEGYPLSLITDRVGHGDSNITRKIYLHITHKQHLKFDEAIQDFK
ncbi:tyrosine-type recombinase/integrase [Lactobacillus gasseri]|jgi:integrase|nr:tyrosine-type recombinase/integrase [Lactobacillus gasseri]MCZ3668577.1 tyrosine-type recombinase/integrase [Lactobacillus gasseri]